MTKEPPPPAVPAPDAVLSLEDAQVVRTSDPWTVLLNSATWTVRQGDFWVIGGLPGAGKSELLEAAAGLTPLTSGRLLLFNQDPGKLRKRELDNLRRRVGFVYSEGGRLINELTIEQNVALPLCYHRNCGPADVRDQVQALLRITGLRHCEDWLPWRLRRAWCQRVALVRALALEPEILLLDDPTASLDMRQTRWWVDFLGQLAAGHPLLARRPTTIILASDDLRPWLPVARQFAVLRDRGLHVVGGSAAVRTSQDAVLRELLEESTAHS